MEIIITRIFETLLLPPAINIIMILLGFIFLRRFYRTGIFIMVSGFVLLIILSMPITASLSIRTLEATPVIDLNNVQAQAIVVLGAGRYSDAPEYDGADSVSMLSLSRLNYAVYLHKKTGLPLLLSGGSPYGEYNSEAKLMQQTLQNNYSLQAQWQESQSNNTQANASMSYAILAKHNIKKIILVTHASHMPRANQAFINAGFKVTPAPMGFHRQNKQLSVILRLLPSVAGLAETHAVLREYMGQLWYWFRY